MHRRQIEAIQMMRKSVNDRIVTKSTGRMNDDAGWLVDGDEALALADNGVLESQAVWRMQAVRDSAL
jgi:hypothetical protein